ncbi:MAG: pantoate--beta-alanine ligase [Elusimicrobiota bacterium]|jgi:pantoate--beta-alanine ligase|nr:pantoate--beta-alanine ligase [Elusimicrobiota bacterium]
MPQLTTTIKETRDIVNAWKSASLSIGFVPTMGYLHEGHKSLIRQAAQHNDRVVVSIFVNPIQFGPTEDLAKYPRDLKKDIAACKEAGAHLVFHPSVEEMYEDNFSTYVETLGVSDELCGKSRPCHFKGVATVVAKLFNIIGPTRAYFGQKDAQQAAVVRRMVRDLNMPLEIITCPIVRESDGLALSSRNIYLNPQERLAALCLSRAVFKGQNLIASGERDAKKIEEILKREIQKEPLAKIDYLNIVSFDTIKPIEKLQGKILCALAVFIGKTRLIDNFIYEVNP